MNPIARIDAAFDRAAAEATRRRYPALADHSDREVLTIREAAEQEAVSWIVVGFIVVTGVSMIVLIVPLLTGLSFVAADWLAGVLGLPRSVARVMAAVGPFAFVVTAGTAIVVRGHRGRLDHVICRDHVRVCPACGHDLTANASGVCPECGRAVAHTNDAEPR